jgi:hypothetical protein
LLTGLCELRVCGYCRASLGGLRELTALQQLTSLGFTAEMRAATMSEVLAAALSDPGEYEGENNGPASQAAVRASLPVVKKERMKKAAKKSS